MNDDQKPKRKATKKEVAAYLQVTTRTIDNQMKAGLPYIKIGKLCRFDFDDVDHWLRERSFSR